MNGLSLEIEQQHSLASAMVARHIAQRADASTAFTAALLHDVGKLLLADRFRDRYGELLLEAEGDNHALHELEAEHLGVTHDEAGAYLLGVWGLPPIPWWKPWPGTTAPARWSA